MREVKDNSKVCGSNNWKDFPFIEIGKIVERAGLGGEGRISCAI